MYRELEESADQETEDEEPECEAGGGRKRKSRDPKFYNERRNAIAKEAFMEDKASKRGVRAPRSKEEVACDIAEGNHLCKGFTTDTRAEMEILIKEMCNHMRHSFKFAQKTLRILTLCAGFMAASSRCFAASMLPP